MSGFTRRDLFGLLQLAGAGAAGAALANGGARAAGETIKGTCRLCLMRCGTFARVRDRRRIERVEGDPASDSGGFVCLHGHALPELVHSPARLARPLRRVARGGDRFEEVSWKAALSEIAERLLAVKAKWGPAALAVETGWPFVGHPLLPFIHRFVHAFGSPNLITVASSCEAAGRIGKALTAGSAFWPEARLARTLIVWGANPPISAPRFGQQVASLRRPGHHLVVVDPVRTALAATADLHLQIRPGTDGALALGMIREVIERGLYDASFVREHTVGFDDLAAAARRWDPEQVEKVTGIARGDLSRAVELYTAHRPAAIWDGLGIEHHDNGLQTVRAIAALQAITGNIDVEGGARLHHREAFGPMSTPEPVPPPVLAKPLGWERFPIFEIYNRQAQGNLLTEAILEDRPYPVRALILMGSNALVTSAGSARLREAVKKLDLLVSIDPFKSASGELADFILPASTFAEDGAEKLIDPVHESRPDWKILFELARELGLGAHFPWSSFEEALAAPAVPWLVDPDRGVRPDTGVPAGARFPTPSGKIELSSMILSWYGYDATPTWRPPALAPDEEFPLRLVTGPRTAMYINSQLRGLGAFARKVPEPIAVVPLAAAERAGVEDGGRVRVSSPIGSLVMRARVDPTLHPDVVVVPAGWAEANANALTSGEVLDPISGFPAYRSQVCRIERA